MITKKEHNMIYITGVKDYCNAFSLTISIIALILAVIGLPKLFILGILFCVIISFAHFLLYLSKLKRLKNESLR